MSFFPIESLEKHKNFLDSSEYLGFTHRPINGIPHDIIPVDLSEISIEFVLEKILNYQVKSRLTNLYKGLQTIINHLPMDNDDIELICNSNNNNNNSNGNSNRNISNSR